MGELTDRMIARTYLTLTRITVEPMVFVFFLALSMTGSAGQLMYIAKVCHHLNYTSEVCANLENPEHQLERTDVQDEVTKIATISIFIGFLPASLSTLLLCNAADIIGRKSVMKISIFGFLLHNLNFIINWVFKESSPYFLLFENVHSIFGGETSLTIGYVLYISDITSHRKRTFRLTVVGVLNLIGKGVGVFASGLFMEHLGFFGVFGIGITLIVFCGLYTHMYVKETLASSENISFSAVFDFENIVDGFKIVLKRRENGERSIILLLVLSFLLVAIQFLGYGSLFLLYMQQLGWTYSQYTTYLGIATASGLLGSSTLVPFLITYVGLSDMTFAVVAEISVIISCILIAFTQPGARVLPYVAYIFGLITSPIGTMIKSALSKVVERNEVSRVLAFLGMLMPLCAIGPPIFNLVYRDSLQWEWCRATSDHANHPHNALITTTTETPGKMEKNWCITAFIWLGIGVLLVNIILYLIVGWKIKKRKTIDNDI